jgi:hypothetical protein
LADVQGIDQGAKARVGEFVVNVAMDFLAVALDHFAGGILASGP